MLGELRASHLELYSQELGPGSDIVVGETGLTLDYPVLDTQKRFRIAGVLPASPAARAGIPSGGYIQAIDGTPVAADADLYKLLAGTVGHRVKMTIADKPNGKGKEYALKPVDRTAIMDLVYDDWVNSRRRMVDSLSGGRLAYLHIQAMGDEDLEKFREQLVSIGEPKEGLVIDVRNNPGGYIAVYLLEILFKEPYLMRTFRDFPATTETKMRSKAVEKPMILLTNNYSGSNAEILAEGFRRLKLGKIVGEPTGSAVIGTGEYALIDGQRIRRPSWGAFTLDKEDTELQPRRPDIFVENLPDDFINGRDPQLVRAVTELLQELK
jgi:C-terminal processing protease CtpA/Prc